MSTYEYYEFLALDRPLSPDEQAELREVSTRAEITATGFTNEYHWGSFKGDPYAMTTRYFDAHLHYADWGERTLLLKLPRKAVDVKAVEHYRADGGLTVIPSSEHVVFEFAYSTEEPPEYDEDWDGDELRFPLAALTGVRDEIAKGDLRALYLAWLASYGRWEIDEEAFPADDETRLEPPVPPGLKSLSGPQRAMADFMRLDRTLLKVAAEASPNRTAPGVEITGVIAKLRETQKDKLLARVAAGEGEKVRLELLAKARKGSGEQTDGDRTVGQILDRAAELRQAAAG
ncbi:hypothetical protein LO763_01800 [Glycomyces sp. A-F 0318]|uniref:hypothetical protein n=1 Tax=Glycomyces amatae TaxID=2881355 RepID=UPI001E4003D7|nr:hypothetical protein [Glycomyces amatae]MCD0442360.1 hypothetical protein [Glycomyces amatae]